MSMVSTSELVEELLRMVGRIVQATYGDVDVDADTPLLTTGLLDSLSLVDLQDALEERFDVRLSPDELGYDSADTVRQLASLIESRPS